MTTDHASVRRTLGKPKGPQYDKVGYLISAIDSSCCTHLGPICVCTSWAAVKQWLDEGGFMRNYENDTNGDSTYMSRTNPKFVRFVVVQITGIYSERKKEAKNDVEV